MARLIVARRWKTPRALVLLMCIEFCFTVAALALFGIADPNLYRTKLWQAGSDAGFNSNPNEVLYAYANYRPIKVPLVWSQFITSFNVVISVLSMFILLVKSVFFVMHIWYPILSAPTHAILCVLYIVSLHAQVAPDMSDPLHPQPGAPWYITKGCGAVNDPAIVGYCKQAKASFAVTVCLLGLFTAYMILSIISSIPSALEKAYRENADYDSEQDSYGLFSKVKHYKPQLVSTVTNTITTDQQKRRHNSKLGYYETCSTPIQMTSQQAWKANLLQQQQQLSQPQWQPQQRMQGQGQGHANTTAATAATPRTVAFKTLEGSSADTSPSLGSSKGGGLPFREQYSAAPDGR